MTNRQLLSVPQAPVGLFRGNFIRQVVCELRFPTMFELDEPKPPLPFANGLRKEYGVYERVAGLEVNAGAVASSHTHTFRSTRHAWTVSLRTSAVTLETQQYTNFEELSNRVKEMIRCVAPVIDSDFFTRVGLRYINAVPLEPGGGDVDEWVRPELVAGTKEAFGHVSEFSHRISGFIEDGTYLFQHGFGGTNEKTEYLLDFDFAHDNVEAGNVLTVLPALHSRLFDFFVWSLGDKAVDRLKV